MNYWVRKENKSLWLSLLNSKKSKSFEWKYIKFESQFLMERWNIKEMIWYEFASQRNSSTLISPARNMSEKKFKVNSSSLRVSETPTMKNSKNLLNFENLKCVSFWNDSENEEKKQEDCIVNLNLTIGDLMPVE